jgi:Acyl-coenzyme A synthetases/AMP-(fatty) acid ligases
VQAHIVLKAGVARDEACAKRLKDHVKAKIAPYKYPRSVKFVTELPRTPDRQDSALQAEILGQC